MFVELVGQHGHGCTRVLDDKPRHRRRSGCRCIGHHRDGASRDRLTGKVGSRRFQPRQCDKQIAFLYAARVIGEPTHLAIARQAVNRQAILAAGASGPEALQRLQQSSQPHGTARGAMAAGARSSQSSQMAPGSTGEPAAGR